MKKVVFWLFVNIFIGSGCGQTGPLMLPIDENSQKTTEYDWSSSKSMEG